MYEYERDELKQQILYLKNRVSELEAETQEKNSIASLYQTKALYWQEIAERERKKIKEYISKIELLEATLDQQLTELQGLKEEQELNLEVIHELQEINKNQYRNYKDIIKKHV